LVHQFREFLIALWLSAGRQGLALLTIGTTLVVCATAAAQVGLNAWNRPFYEAISARNFLGFLHQLLVFAAIAGGLLVLNVAQAWLREMIKLRSREWLTRDLLAEWLNPDQRIHEDARRLTELSTDLGVGLLQASLLLLSFLGVLWTVSGALEFSNLRGQSRNSGLHGVVCGSLCCERFLAHVAHRSSPRNHEFSAVSARV